jgi:hypothetical protein
MEWKFTTELTLEEKKSGYIIYLLSGSWAEPLDVTSKTLKPMTATEKAQYLRLGLEFARDFMQDFIKKEELKSY